MHYNINIINSVLKEQEAFNPYINPENDTVTANAIQFISEELNLPFETVRRVLELHVGIYILEINSSLEGAINDASN